MSPLPAAAEDRRTFLLDLGHSAGLDRVGVTPADPFPGVREELERRTTDGSRGGLTFTYNQPGRSTDIRQSIPWAHRLVVGGRAYLPDAGTPSTEGALTGRIARFSVEDFYQPLHASLQRIADELVACGYRAEIVSDDNRLVDRAAAVRAGVGWWGKNSMVLAPGQGPWMLLGSVVTDADIAVTVPMTRDCGTCDACLPACPTGALVAPGVLDARLCLAAILQTQGSIPEELREPMGDRIYGCDDCLDACPPGTRLLGRSSTARGRVDLEWVLTASDDELLESFERFYLPRRRPAVLRRNALIAAGNDGRHRLSGAVEPYLDCEDPILSEHARWAWERLDQR